MRLTILHTNDIHGREDRIAQIATIVERERATASHPVIYMDAGDVEETTNRLSNLTKGTALHRLMNHTGCAVATVGNACWLRYGPGVLAEHARVALYPLLLANLQPVDGPVPSVLLGDVGVIGLTASFADFFGSEIDWGFAPLPEVELTRGIARELRAGGAELVVVLSHLGLGEGYNSAIGDRLLAGELQGDVDLIVGAHSHDLLPDGEWVGDVLVVQAGCYGDHIGRVEIDGDVMTVHVDAVPDDTPLHPAVLAEAESIELEIRAFLDEQIGVLDAPLDGDWIAAMLRERMGAEVGLVAAGQALRVEALPAGPLTRGALWEACESPANPGIATIRGDLLARMVERGDDPAFAAETPRPLRGRPRGRLHVSGTAPFDPARDYQVAGTDWELEHYGGLVDAEWGVRGRYDFPTIVREAIEEHLRR